MISRCFNKIHAGRDAECNDIADNTAMYNRADEMSMVILDDDVNSCVLRL